MANGDALETGRFLNLPLWAKIITLVGPVGAIAFYLVWVGAQILPHLDQEILLNKAAMVKSQDMIKEGNDQLRENYRLLIRLCVNTSKNTAQSDECFGKRRTYE